jgi:serine/threonine protein kinase
MLFGRAPFRGKKKPEIFEQIKKCDINYEGDASPDAIQFCKKMLCLDKSIRASAKDLLNHPWLLKNTQKLKVESEALLNVGNNLKEFRSASVF